MKRKNVPFVKKRYIHFADARNTVSLIAEATARGYLLRLGDKDKKYSNLIREIRISSSGTLVDDMKSKKDWQLFNIMQNYLEELEKTGLIELDEKLAFYRRENADELRKCLDFLRAIEMGHIRRVISENLLRDYTSQARIEKQEQITSKQKANLVLLFSMRDYWITYGIFSSRKRRPKLELLSDYTGLEGEIANPFIMLDKGQDYKKIGKNVISVTKKAMQEYLKNHNNI